MLGGSLTLASSGDVEVIDLKGGFGNKGKGLIIEFFCGGLRVKRKVIRDIFSILNKNKVCVV